MLRDVACECGVPPGGGIASGPSGEIGASGGGTGAVAIGAWTAGAGAGGG